MKNSWILIIFLLVAAKYSQKSVEAKVLEKPEYLENLIQFTFF